MSDITSKKEILEYWGKHNSIKELKGKHTLTEIAEAIETDQGQFSKQVNGNLNISLCKLVQIADFLDCKASELLPKAWQAQTVLSPDKLYENIRIVTQSVEEFLISGKKTFTPEKKAEFIARLCEVTLDLPNEEKRAKVIDISDFILRYGV